MKTLAQLFDKREKSIFEDDIPSLREGQWVNYAICGHHMRVTATAELGRDTGRRRYRVECLTCGEVVHEATTGARWNIEHHVREAERAKGSQQ